MNYTVGEMAEMLGTTASTLRYYDKEGLLPFVERSSGGIRLFKESDFEWLSIIECLKKTGMPIKEIKRFIDLCMEGDATIAQRLALILSQKKTAQAQIKEMQNTLDMLDYKEWYYEIAQKAGSCAVHDTIRDEDVPERYRKTREIAKGTALLTKPSGRAPAQQSDV